MRQQQYHGSPLQLLVIRPHEPCLAAGSHLQVSLPCQLPACKQPLFSQIACFA